jgi:hypothetical protein
MKKLMLSIAFILLGWAAMADGDDDFHLVITKNDTLVCEGFKFGQMRTTLYMSNGETILVNTKDVLKYYDNKKVFEKMPVVMNSKATNQYAWMELKRQIYDLKVYQHTTYDSYVQKTINSFYVFNNKGKFMVQINEQNKATLLPFLELSEN